MIVFHYRGISERVANAIAGDEFEQIGLKEREEKSA